MCKRLNFIIFFSKYFWAAHSCPITAYRALIPRGSTKIENKNITDMSVKHQDIGSLNKSTNYTVKLFARNYVFEGKATERKIQTKYEGMKICTKSAYELYSVSWFIYIFIYLFIFMNAY